MHYKLIVTVVWDLEQTSYPLPPDLHCQRTGEMFS